jgi:hypothetical protein
MAPSKRKKHHHFTILYRYFDDLRPAVELAKQKSVKAVVIRSANDGGDLALVPEDTPCLTLNLETNSGFDEAVSLLEDRSFDCVFFTADPERDLQSVQVAPGELRFAQEVMWRRLGANGRIIGYPLHDRIRPKFEDDE